MNATTETAERGFAFFKARPDRTLDEINNLLAREGREPIHARSLAHYKNLRDHGVYAYMPINQFDVRRSAGML